MKKDIEHKDDQINLLKEQLKQANNTLRTAQSPLATTVQKKERQNKKNRASEGMKNTNKHQKEMKRKNAVAGMVPMTVTVRVTLVPVSSISKLQRRSTR